MPRLRAWREYEPFNDYDALFLGLDNAKKLRHTETLFSDGHIGNAGWTNLQWAGALTRSNECTCVVQNWYARTNIPACENLDIFANNTIVYFSVGHHPLRQMSLYDLLRRDETRLMSGPVEPAAAHRDREQLVEHVAEAIHVGRQRYSDAPATWHDEKPQIRELFLEDARRAIRAVNPTERPVIVPVRQNVAVQVAMYAGAKDALVAAIQRWWGIDGAGTMIAAATDPARPSVPGLWLHLAGQATRDVA